MSLNLSVKSSQMDFNSVSSVRRLDSLDERSNEKKCYSNCEVSYSRKIKDLSIDYDCSVNGERCSFLLMFVKLSAMILHISMHD